MNLTAGSSGAAHTRRTFLRALAGGALAAAGCRLPQLKLADTIPEIPGTFNGAASPDNSACLRVEEFFGDPQLANLIHLALAGNQELKILAQDIQIANNEVLARTGAYLPFATLRGGISADRSSRYTREGAVDDQLTVRPFRRFPKVLPEFLIAANVSWQVDIWRKLRNLRDAAALRYLATAEGRNYTITRIVADVADNYFSLLSLDQRVLTLNEIIRIQQESLRLARLQLEGGKGTELPVQRFEADVRKSQSELLLVRQDIIEAENRINFLAGRFPQPVERTTVDFFDLNLSALAVGVPAQLLQNRPDIRQAERELTAAGLEVKVARAEFFPQLDITGGLGYEAFDPKYLFQPEAFIANAAGELVTPLVNRTAIRTAFSTANARQLQRVYDYQRIVLDAFTEVVNRVSAVQNYRQSVEIKRQQITNLRAAVDTANKLFNAGRVNYLEVLPAQRDLLDAQTALIETKRQQLSAVVNAYQALGGGGYLAPALVPPPLTLKSLLRGPADVTGIPAPQPVPAPPPPGDLPAMPVPLPPIPPPPVALPPIPMPK